MVPIGLSTKKAFIVSAEDELASIGRRSAIITARAAESPIPLPRELGPALRRLREHETEARARLNKMLQERAMDWEGDTGGVRAALADAKEAADEAASLLGPIPVRFIVVEGDPRAQAPGTGL